MAEWKKPLTGCIGRCEHCDEWTGDVKLIFFDEFFNVAPMLLCDKCEPIVMHKLTHPEECRTDLDDIGD